MKNYRFLTALLMMLLLVVAANAQSTWRQINVAGSFNSWSPNAKTGEMKLEDGLWKAKFFLHAGLVEYKFAANGGWQASWGNPEISEALPQMGKAIRDAGNIKAAVESSGWYEFVLSPEKGEFSLDKLQGQQPTPPEPPTPPTPPTPPSGKDFREETIYFLITTRFYDGDPENNFYCRDRVKKGDPHWRGDFKGLISKLDYLKDLGFTALWITPPVENRSGLDYHGYHAYDWNRVDPRLESPGARSDKRMP